VVSEAVENSIEHGYGLTRDGPAHPGVVEVSARTVTGPEDYHYIELTIRDHGRWRPYPAGHGNRHRGIPLMHATMDQVIITGTDHGTTVGPPQPPAPPALGQPTHESIHNVVPARALRRRHDPHHGPSAHGWHGWCGECARTAW
jgi:hypothetical protein